MGMSEDKELAHPLLGPLFGRAPAGVLPHVGKPRIDGKRVRWRLSRLLVARRLPVTTPQMRAATGFEHKEIGAALAKMVRAGDVRVHDNFDGKLKGYEWIRA